MRALVTGASSFVGRAMAARLAAGGVEVREFSRAEDGDIRDRQAVARALAGCDAVVHLAYAKAVAPDGEILDVAVSGMASVLQACELHEVRDLMLVSSSRAACSADAYGTGKMAAEAMAQAWAQAGSLDRVVVARVYNAFGPDMGTYHVIPQLIAKAEPGDSTVRIHVRGSGLDVRSFIYVDDCAEQLYRLFTRAVTGTRKWDVGSAEAKTIADVARAIGRSWGKPVIVVPEQPGAPRTVSLPRIPEFLAGAARVRFQEGIDRTVAWYRSQGEGK